VRLGLVWCGVSRFALGSGSGCGWYKGEDKVEDEVGDGGRVRDIALTLTLTLTQTGCHERKDECECECEDEDEDEDV